MSGPVSEGYSIDTNVVIDGRGRSYPPDVFGTLWDRVETLVAEGRAIAADEVAWELGRGDDDCHAWATALVGFVVPTEDDELAVVARISVDYPDWSSQQANWADPFVIAHAFTRGWTVVTNERFSRSPIPARISIPNVCADFGIECISFVEMARRESWVF